MTIVGTGAAILAAVFALLPLGFAIWRYWWDRESPESNIVLNVLPVYFGSYTGRTLRPNPDLAYE